MLLLLLLSLLTVIIIIVAITRVINVITIIICAAIFFLNLLWLRLLCCYCYALLKDLLLKSFLLLFLSMNLYELIKKNNFQGFSIPLIRRFAFSILQCLKVLQKDRIIHCDLKPVSESLLTSDGKILSLPHL